LPNEVSAQIDTVIGKLLFFAKDNDMLPHSVPNHLLDKLVAGHPVADHGDCIRAHKLSST
jgi:hypothetical protein